MITIRMRGLVAGAAFMHDAYADDARNFTAAVVAARRWLADQDVDRDLVAWLRNPTIDLDRRCGGLRVYPQWTVRVMPGERPEWVRWPPCRCRTDGDSPCCPSGPCPLV